MTGRVSGCYGALLTAYLRTACRALARLLTRLPEWLRAGLPDRVPAAYMPRSWPITAPLAAETVITLFCTVALAALLSQGSVPTHRPAVAETFEKVTDSFAPGFGLHVPVSWLHPSKPVKVRSAEIVRNGEVRVRVSVQ